jgi:hypothetical protein
VTKAVETRTKPTVCRQCGAPLAQAGRGRPRTYCSDACRRAAQRARATAWEWLQTEDPQSSAAWLDQDLPSLDDLLYEAEHGRRPAATPSPEQSGADAVARTLLAASAVCAELRRHAVAAEPRIAARCAAVADALDGALTREFG